MKTLSLTPKELEALLRLRASPDFQIFLEALVKELDRATQLTLFTPDSEEVDPMRGYGRAFFMLLNTVENAQTLFDNARQET